MESRSLEEDRGAPRKRVVVIDDGYGSYATEQRILAAVNADVVVLPCRGDAARVREVAADADALLVRESPVNAAAIAAMQRCRAIVRYGIGVDNVDLDAARDKRIYVANVPDYGVEEVSDQALALLMAVARYTVRRDGAVRAGAWNVSREQKMYRIAGRTLGLVGYGRIARAFERKMRGMGVARVLVYDPFLDPAKTPGVECVDLDTLCAESDYISLHSPLTPDTRKLINAARLARMKPTTILVNTARGGLIDEAALIDALQRRAIFGAGLDVFENEPPRAGHPLFACENAVLSDHTGWYSEDSVAELQTKAAQEVARVLGGDQPKHWVNPWSAV
ncbi:C-terminal binding protein [Paraburkholderia tropica]|uniref:C-terminal binding protein n=1 Tax=Paraburkholderia tropica TaxID=92647 RepID=UPI0017F248BF|nr:C-terminal binding protein [Paraburkholderia tropica]MBB2979925.1 D-3-phosphoglycerate dehydrogenase [Paraburkholderia tropica]